MANPQDNLQALFGGNMLPQDMQQELINQRAKEFAQLTPSQQLGALGYKAGAALGGGLAQAMGVDITDPRIKRQAQLQQLAQGVQNTSEGLQAFAQKLQAAGFTVEAAQAMDKAREIAKTEAETGLKGAQAQKALNFEAARTDSEKKRTLLSDVEQALSSNEQVDPAKLNQARLAWAQETRPKTFQQSDGSIVTVPGVDVNLFPNLGKALTAGGSSGVRTAGVVETPASIEAKTKDVQAAESTVRSLQNSLDTLGELQKLRENKDWTTNPWVADTMSKFPTQARTQSNLVKSQIADKVIGVIGEMKSQSKTGATGFGALNMAELDKLESTVRRLDPLDPNFDKDIQYVIDKVTENKKLITTELERKKQKLETATGAKPSGMSGRNPQLQPTEESWVERAMAANPSFSRAQVITEGIKAKKLPADYK